MNFTRKLASHPGSRHCERQRSNPVARQPWAGLDVTRIASPLRGLAMTTLANRHCERAEESSGESSLRALAKQSSGEQADE
jgi:hypothetical protein